MDADTENWMEEIGGILMDEDTELAAEQLKLALANDPNPSIRNIAMESLSVLGILDPIRDSALNDADPSLREKAARLVEMH